MVNHPKEHRQFTVPSLPGYPNGLSLNQTSTQSIPPNAVTKTTSVSNTRQYCSKPTQQRTNKLNQHHINNLWKCTTMTIDPQPTCGPKANKKNTAKLTPTPLRNRSKPNKSQTQRQKPMSNANANAKRQHHTQTSSSFGC